MIEEAIARWEASGLVPTGFDWSKLRFAITDLGPAYLGLGNPDGSILLDDDGAGWGWFVDDTPSDDGEFAVDADSQAARHMDLLTVVMHEIGHALGYPTGSALGTPAESLLSEFLTLGTRRSPGVAASETVPSDLLADEAQAAPMLGFARLASFDFAPLALSQSVDAPTVSAAPATNDNAAGTSAPSAAKRGVTFELNNLEIVTATVDGDEAESSLASEDAEPKRSRLDEIASEL
jgi:hypothetical protein